MAKSGTQIFGIRLGVDPKFVAGGIIALAALLFWYNSRGDDEGSNAPAAVRPAPAVTMPKSHLASIRRDRPSNDQRVLRLRPVDPTRGDVDPTLRLDLLQRLQSVDDVPHGRSLFDLGPTPAQVAAAAAAAAAAPIHGPMIQPKPVTTAAAAMPTGPAPLNIPLKFYGFVKPTDLHETNRGFFMDGDNVLVATEGEVLKQKYRVLELSAKSARLEDIQLRRQETLQVVPEAIVQ